MTHKPKPGRNRKRGPRTRIAPLKHALRLPLLFHETGAWTVKTAGEWYDITGTNEKTIDVMCDHIRKVLGDSEL